MVKYCYEATIRQQLTRIDIYAMVFVTGIICQAKAEIKCGW